MFVRIVDNFISNGHTIRVRQGGMVPVDKYISVKKIVEIQKKHLDLVQISNLVNILYQVIIH